MVPGAYARKVSPSQSAHLEQLLGVPWVRLHSVGGESRTYRLEDGHGPDPHRPGTTPDNAHTPEVTHRLVTVGPDWPTTRRTADDLDQEARLLRGISGRVGVAVPQVVEVSGPAGVLVIRELPGRRLLDVPRWSPGLVTAAADAMARTLAELHTWPLETCEHLAPRDPTPPSVWRDDTAERARALADSLTAHQRVDLETFLARPTPEPATDLRLTHNDLGIEHVLVDVDQDRVTGIIDWSDTAVTDPAVDFGRLLRDLGPKALARALDTYAAVGGDPRTVLPRITFYAGCTLVEDLAFGLSTGRMTYADKSLLSWRSILGGSGERRSR